MVDANFKLKLKDKGIADTHLASGWAYFVDDKKFQAYLQEHSGDQSEVNSWLALLRPSLILV